MDADVADAVTENTLDNAVAFAKNFAAKTGSIIAITGAIDLVADAENCYVIRNGRAEMGRITGTGCQLSGMMTAFLAANPENKLDAAAAASAALLHPFLIAIAAPTVYAQQAFSKQIGWIFFT